NATLAWSTDHGKTWTWGLKLDTSFGCPTFVNFGRNYENERDEYVYTCSPDGPSAYEPADAIVTARAPRDRLRERDAYSFYAGADKKGQPLWSPDIRQRAPIFRNPSHCERIDVV